MLCAVYFSRKKGNRIGSVPIRLCEEMKKEGQITIYLSLSFAIILSLFVSIYDTARMSCAKVCAKCLADSALTSAFGEFNKELFEEYDLYYVDLSYLSNSPSPDNIARHIENFMKEEADLSSQNTLFRISDVTGFNAETAELCRYRLATDNSGDSFKRQAIDYMKSLALGDVENRVLGYSSILDIYQIDIDQSSENLTNFTEESEVAEWAQTTLGYDSQRAISGMVFDLSDETELTDHVIDISDTTLIRKLNAGNYGESTEFFSPADEILFNEYIMFKFSHRTDLIKDHYMHMEAEYVVNGMPTDLSNEYNTLLKILFIRLAANDITINSDKDLKDKAKVIGEIISKLTDIPEEAATQGVIYFWSIAEGLVDVTDIARDVRVPLIKQGDEIQLDVSNFLERQQKLTDSSSGSGTSLSIREKLNDLSGHWYVEGEEQYQKYGHGLDYEEYLRILLYLSNPFIKQYRVMDMIELNLRHSQTGNEFFRMDVCTDMIEVNITTESSYGYRFTMRRKYSYF